MLIFKNYKLKVSEHMGRGLYASENIDCGTLICQCELLVLSPADTVKVNETDLKYYTFRFNDEQDCLVMGDGEIFNHGYTEVSKLGTEVGVEHANVSYSLEDFEGRKVMRFYTTESVETGKQLFIDYSADTKGLDVTGHITNSSLVG